MYGQAVGHHPARFTPWAPALLRALRLTRRLAFDVACVLGVLVAAAVIDAVVMYLYLAH